MQAEAPIQERANKYYLSRFDGEMRQLIDEASDYSSDEHDASEERLREIPLSLEKLSTDHRAETTTWEILLGTGGPADRVLVTTDERGTVESAVWEFQDWYQPWTAAENQDADLVQRFAEIVGFYGE